MRLKSKVILGQKRVKDQYFSLEMRHRIIKDYLESGWTKRKIWEKYTGEPQEHGVLLKWMRELGYTTSSKKAILAPLNSRTMKKKASKDLAVDDFETLQLKKRIADLEAQLKDAELKAIAFSTMVDVAERELNISIRKKYNTKPSKK